MGTQNMQNGQHGQTNNGTIAGAKLISLLLPFASKNAAWAMCSYSRAQNALIVTLSKTCTKEPAPLREGGNLLERPIKLDQLRTPETNVLLVELLRSKSVYDDTGSIWLRLPQGMSNTLIDTINKTVEAVSCGQTKANLLEAVKHLLTYREGSNAFVRDTFDLSDFEDVTLRSQIMSAAGIPLPRIRGTNTNLLDFDA